MNRLLLPVSILVIAVAVGCAGTRADAPSPEEATLTTVGQVAPSLTVTTMDGETFDLAAQRGRVVLLNFWATWCPPCRQELPAVRDEIWARHHARDDFVLISVSREEAPEVVSRFLADRDFGWMFATDPDRTNYARFADAHIPRNYVIDRRGRIAYQSVGFEPAEFAALVGTVDDLLD